MSDVTSLFSDKMKVLLCLYEYIGPDGYSRLSQQEISEKLGINRITINKLVKELVNDGYIEQDKDRLSKYLLTKKAVNTIKVVKKIE